MFLSLFVSAAQQLFSKVWSNYRSLYLASRVLPLRYLILFMKLIKDKLGRRGKVALLANNKVAKGCSQFRYVRQGLESRPNIDQQHAGGWIYSFNELGWRADWRGGKLF